MSHDPSETILIRWFIFSVETVVLLNIIWNLWYFLFLILWWIKSLNEQDLFKILIFSNNISLHYHFLSFKTSSLNKSINFFKKERKNTQYTNTLYTLKNICFNPNAGFRPLGHLIVFFYIFLPSLWAGFGVSHPIFQLRGKHKMAVWSSQLPHEQQSFTCSDFGNTPARELALFRCKAITENGWIHLN